MEFQVEIKYEDKGYDLEIYPFNGNSLSQSYFEGKDNLVEVMSSITKFFERISLVDNHVYFSSNYNKEKRRVSSIKDIENYAIRDFESENDI
jgi:hypothetical protein